MDWRFLSLFGLALLATLTIFVTLPELAPGSNLGAEVLIAALAFVVLLFTFLSQLRSSADTFATLSQQTAAARSLAKVQVLALQRANIGDQIRHLKSLLHTTLPDGAPIPDDKIAEKEEELALDGHTRDSAKTRIAELKQHLAIVELETRDTYRELGLTYEPTQLQRATPSPPQEGSAVCTPHSS